MVAQGLAQLRTGTKSLSGFSFKQVGFWFIHPLSFGSPPPLSRLFRQTPHQALPFPTVHQTLFGESIALLCMLWSISDYLLCRSHWEESPEIQVSSTSCGSLWCEDRFGTWEGNNSLSLGEETVSSPSEHHPQTPAFASTQNSKKISSGIYFLDGFWT